MPENIPVGDLNSVSPKNGASHAAGSAVGVALGASGLPFVEAAFGTAGLRIALLWDLANVAAGEPPGCGQVMPNMLKFSIS